MPKRLLKQYENRDKCNISIYGDIDIMYIAETVLYYIIYDLLMPKLLTF